MSEILKHLTKICRREAISNERLAEIGEALQKNAPIEQFIDELCVGFQLRVLRQVLGATNYHTENTSAICDLFGDCCLRVIMYLRNVEIKKDHPCPENALASFVRSCVKNALLDASRAGKFTGVSIGSRKDRFCWGHLEDVEKALEGAHNLEYDAQLTITSTNKNTGKPIKRTATVKEWHKGLERVSANSFGMDPLRENRAEEDEHVCGLSSVNPKNTPFVSVGSFSLHQIDAEQVRKRLFEKFINLVEKALEENNCSAKEHATAPYFIQYYFSLSTLDLKQIGKALGIRVSMVSFRFKRLLKIITPIIRKNFSKEEVALMANHSFFFDEL
ncbi:hypothetical protein KJ632_02375 [Patescibacteria group bacterium]|nr:hypothetical protein [Patescibacteria group bacterium]